MDGKQKGREVEEEEVEKRGERWKTSKGCRQIDRLMKRERKRERERV